MSYPVPSGDEPLVGGGIQQAVIPIDARRSVSDAYFFQWTPLPSAYHLHVSVALE